MRIGLDARELCGHATGVGRYLSGLLSSWAADPGTSQHQFLLYTHEAISGSHGAANEGSTGGAIGTAIETGHFALRLVPGAGGTRWEQLTLSSAIARDRLDVFFAPGYTAPIFGRTPSVVAIHDVSFSAHPEWFRTREGLRRRFLTRRTAARAHAVVTISEFSKREILEHLRVPADKVHVIPPGIARRWPAPGPEAGATPSGTLLRRVLYVGSIFNRRHVPDLISAVGQLTRRFGDVALDVVGDNRTYPFQAVAAILESQRAGDRLRWHRYVSDEALGSLYGAARAFAFLSEYEGLGLTPLEALSAGVPSVLLDTPVARESCGGAALYVPKDDVPATVEALRHVLFEDATRARLLASAPAVLARYDWPDAARRTLAVLEGAR